MGGEDFASQTEKTLSRRRRRLRITFVSGEDFASQAEKALSRRRRRLCIAGGEDFTSQTEHPTSSLTEYSMTTDADDPKGNGTDDLKTSTGPDVDPPSWLAFGEDPRPHLNSTEGSSIVTEYRGLDLETEDPMLPLGYVDASLSSLSSFYFDFRASSVERDDEDVEANDDDVEANDDDVVETDNDVEAD
ncbi:hypothetical protein AALP_AA6G219100 [Arabis alpina]|uniref:Uncharacterized protein n=1 Tax=Arabis alpina TaxID=50452 RepID=A0A087GQV8_ARAAL|nr:hypothetical protein AALP_AA6G219100 [Arabis alpina]